MKKISIIVPIYNVEEYLEECLNSIINQSLGLNNIEVILINDGSSDNSKKVLENYALKHKDFVVVNRENKGVSVTRNEGVELATGEYIMFLDSDDYLNKDALKEMYEVAKKEDSDVLIGRMKAFDSNGFYSYYSDKIITEKKTFSLKENKKILKVISVCCKLYKRSFVKKVQFVPNIRHEDNYFTMSIYTKAKRITTIPKYYYYRRYREGENPSFMQTLSVNNFYDLVKNYELYFDEYDKNKVIISFSVRMFNNYIISRLKKEEKRSAKNRIKECLDFLLKNNKIKKMEYLYFIIYNLFYYSLANVYYKLRNLIK